MYNDLNETKMKRKYEVSYYEYGLTVRKKKKFFLAISALICFLWAEITYGYESYARIDEYDFNDR